jgi:hypothetical protein
VRRREFVAGLGSTPDQGLRNFNRKRFRSGPSRDWIKVKNPDSPAMIRAREVEW